jgi:hypothetical protein
MSRRKDLISRAPGFDVCSTNRGIGADNTDYQGIFRPPRHLGVGGPTSKILHLE